ncbi:MAG: ABC transporter ATP-binding protein [Oscillospiraceae bacterium]|nr:ABC transporter ATP-binding protein [Oscillospiraceae bacterium]
MQKLKNRRGILRPQLKKYGPAYLLGLITLLMVDYVELFVPKLIGEATDGLAAHLLDVRGILIIAGKIVLCGLAVMFGRFWWRRFIFGSARKIERALRDQMFEHLETLPLRYFNTHKTGDLMAYFTNDLEAVRMAIGPAVVTSFDATVLTLLVLYRMMTYVSVKLTLFAMIPMAAIALFGYFFGEVFERRYSKMQKAFAELSDYAQESISGERVVKAFVQEKKQYAAFREVNEKKRRATMRVVRLDAAFGPILHFLVGLTYVVAILLGGYFTIVGDMTLGRFVAFNVYIGSMVWPMLAMGESVTIISQGIAGLDRLHEILDETSDITDPEDPDDVTELLGGISVRNMSFDYREDLPEALHDINLEIAPGETLAVMGRTGSGKSTLVNLLCRMYDVSKGEIDFDGHDVRKIPLSVLRRGIAYVPQDNFLFSDTLAGNISFGKADATEEEIIAASEAAQLHSDVLDFPEGYATVVGERGVTLSGGQKQRASIARALLKDSPILILDDSLSAVDTDTEETILENLKKIRAGKTTIIIAHRVSTVQNADNVLVLEDGRVAQYGSYAELAEAPGIFREMAEKQRLEQQLQTEE